jgi:hypothetical protein
VTALHTEFFGGAFDVAFVAVEAQSDEEYLGLYAGVLQDAAYDRRVGDQGDQLSSTTASCP